MNVRVIAATHRDLRAHVAQGLFRLDLLYRLDILRLAVPPLRHRLDDFADLAHTLHQRIAERLKQPASATLDVLQALIDLAGSYAWPGNVRELENVLERLIVFGHANDENPQTPVQRLLSLMPELQTALPVQTVTQTALKSMQQQQARQRFADVLAQCHGDRAQAARQLGISRTTLWRKLRQP